MFNIYVNKLMFFLFDVFCCRFIGAKINNIIVISKFKYKKYGFFRKNI